VEVASEGMIAGVEIEVEEEAEEGVETLTAGLHDKARDLRRASIYPIE
jgi:hypothetical protein